jgi:hypothetical protein
MKPIPAEDLSETSKTNGYIAIKNIAIGQELGSTVSIRPFDHRTSFSRHSALLLR